MTDYLALAERLERMANREANELAEVMNDSAAALREAHDRLAVENAESMRQYNEMGLRIDLERAEAEVERLNKGWQEATESIAEYEDQVERLRALLEQTKHDVEIARIWGGQDWIWNSVPSFVAKRVWTRIDVELGENL